MAIEWSAKIEGLDGLGDRGQAAVHEGVINGLNEIGVFGSAKVQDYIRAPFGSKPPAVATGNLAASIMHEVDAMAEEIRLIIGVSPTLGADKYAPAVEEDTRPHMPPFDALDAWVMVKFHPETEEDLRDMANAMLRKIYHHGTKGHKMFERTLPDVESMAPGTLEKSIAQSLIAAGFGG